MFCESKYVYESRPLVSKSAPRVFCSLRIEPILEQPRMGPFWRVSVNRDDPQARLSPVEAILFLFLLRAPRMHAQCIHGHEKHHGRKCAARVQLVCWPCVGISLSPAGFASIDHYRKKGQLSALSYFRSVSHVWLASINPPSCSIRIDSTTFFN